MKLFEKYADFYDSYYRNKDYNAEVNFVLDLANQNSTPPHRTILDMGCGTGGHLIPFAKKGLKVTGFDLSEAMIYKAKEKITKADIKAKVQVDDARTYRDGKKYNLVVSMFAVMGYLTSNEDFLAGLKTAMIHLNGDGIFIFDVWFGPAVLHQMPETRIQKFEKDGLQTLRLVRPELDVIKQIVTINYEILEFKDERTVEVVNESHKMRYFFIQELKFLLENAGLKLIKVCPFMDSSRQPTIDDWNISIVAKKTII